MSPRYSIRIRIGLFIFYGPGRSHACMMHDACALHPSPTSPTYYFRILIICLLAQY